MPAARPHGRPSPTDRDERYIMDFIAANYAPLMFGGLMLFLILGYPVAFSLGAAGIFFGLLGVVLEIFPSSILAVLPYRLIGIMSNETLLAVPFFTLMGLILERSGMAEDLLDSVGQVFAHHAALWL
jgi:TRAP-type mannitol/chloroaromatic compound transport system permease large subunit